MKTTIYKLVSILISTCLLGGLIGAAQAQTKMPDVVDKVFFVEPADQAVVTSPFKVKFGLSGKKIGPVGNLDPNLGHHHLVIQLGSVEKNQSIPFDDQHLHFGAGQTETTLSLLPGHYKLTLQFGNGAHQSYGREMSHTIQVEVKAAQAAKASASPTALPPSAW